MICSPVRVSVRDVANHYDELDSFYRQIWGEHVHHGLWENGDESPDEAVVKFVRYALEHVPIERGARVCDVGCGYGATARLLALEWEASVSALTISVAQHRHAVPEREGKTIQNICFVTG
jgi:cyclopropane fatty-acyl-phospholipid synthase-like methyltransferase